MSATSRVATAVAAGYLLGRTKKLRLAITVGSVLAGGRLAGGGSGNLLKAITDNPQVAELGDQVRGQLLRSAKSAAINVTTSRLESLTDSLRESGGAAEVEGPEDSEEPDEDEQDEGTEDQGPEDEGAEDQGSEDQGAEDQGAEDEDRSEDDGDQPSRGSRGSGGSRRGEGSAKRTPAKKGAAKKAPAKKSAAKKTAAKKSSTRR